MSKIAKNIAMRLAAHDLTYIGKGASVVQEIDRALQGKIISKMEVDALRRDKYFTDCKYQSIVAELAGARSENLRLQEAYNYIKKQTGDEYDILRVENLKLKQENTNLKIDNVSMKAFPLYIGVDLGLQKSWTGTTAPIIRERGQLIHKCDICGAIEPENATHGHSDFEKFVHSLKFWRKL